MLKGLTNTFKQHCNNVELEYSEYVVLNGTQIPIKAQLKDDSYENGNFIGTFILKQISFETEATYEFRNKEFEYYKVVNGESIKIGTFISTDITINDTTEIVKVIGMDYGLKTQVEYTSSLDYASGNITLMDVWNECCSLSGLQSGINDFTNSDFIVDSDQFTKTGATVRDVFKAIAMSSGTFVKVMNDDKIYLIFNKLTSDIKEVEVNGSATIEDGYKLVDLSLQGDTTQNGTPTPESPQPINVVSGRQEVVVCGKNLFNKNTVSTGFLSENGTIISNNDYRTSDFITIKPNTAYYKTLTLSPRTKFYDSNKQLLNTTTYQDISIGGNAGTFITPNNAYYLRFTINITTASVSVDTVMLNEGSTATTYEAYKGQSYEINLGKNLLDTQYYENGSIDGSTGQNVSVPFNARGNNYIPVLPNTIYTFSANTTCSNLRLSEYTSSKTNIQRDVISTNSSITITTTANTYYVRWSLNYNNSTELTQEIISSLQLQLEKGGVQTVYTPYKTPIELCKTGNYKDRIFKNEDKILVPNEYTQVEYIESSGTQYINTEVLINSTSLTNGIVMELETAIKNKSNAQASGKNGHPYFFVGINGSNVFYSGLNTVYYATTLENDENKHTLKIDSINKTFSVDGAIKTNYTINTYDNTYSNNLYLFRVSQVGEYYMYQKLYRAKIYSQNTLVRDMIPCIRNSDNSVGMYDLVNGVFYANAGTGTFTYGEIIGKWNIEKQTNKVVLNGSEELTNGGLITNVRRYSTPLANAKLNDMNNAKLCNYFRYVADWNLDDSHFYISNNGSLIIFSTYTDMTQFRNWLGTNEPMFCFPLETPTYTEITDSELINQLEAIKLIEGLNNITISSGDLSSPLKISYYNNELEIVEDYTELEDKRDTHPWTCLRLGTSQIEGNNLDYIDEELVAQYGENWLILNDNPFAYNQDKRQQLITNIFNQIKEFGYSSFVSKTSFKPYLTSGDIIRFKNRDGDYVKSILLRYTHNAESIQLEAPSETSATINYVRPLSAIQVAKNTQVIVNQDEVKIDFLTSQTQTIQYDLRQNYYTSTQTNELIQTAQTGLTNTFSEAGGNNIFRNTGLWFTTNDNSNPYEFWNGIVAKQKEDRASNMNALLLQNGTLEQEQLVPNGTYTISFKYKKLIFASTISVLINDTEYELTETEETTFNQTIEVSSQHINIKFITNVNNSGEIYDLMVNAGAVSLAYSQNQNETTTDTVNISKGITITSSANEEVKFKADYNGIRTLDRSGNELTKFTDTGMKTKEAIIESKSQIVGTLWQEVGNQTWITKL